MRQSKLFVHWFTPQKPAMAGTRPMPNMGTGSWELSLGLLYQWKALKQLDHHLLTLRMSIRRKLDWQWTWDSKTNTGNQATSETSGILAAVPHAYSMI